MGACLACWRVRGAGVVCCLPIGPCSGWTSFGFALRDDAGVVGWATKRLELDFGVAGWRCGVDVWAERLLPRLVVGSLLASPTIGVGGT